MVRLAILYSIYMNEHFEHMEHNLEPHVDKIVGFNEEFLIDIKNTAIVKDLKQNGSFPKKSAIFVSM